MKKTPDDPELTTRCAGTAVSMEKYFSATRKLEEAFREYRKAIEKSPSKHLSANLAKTDKNLDKALARCDEAIEKSPAKPTSLRRAFWVPGRKAEADKVMAEMVQTMDDMVETVAAVVKDNPKVTEVKANARCHGGPGEIRLFISGCEAKRTPDDREKKLDECLAQLERIFKLKPDDPKGLLLPAVATWQRDKTRRRKVMEPWHRARTRPVPSHINLSWTNRVATWRNWQGRVRPSEHGTENIKATTSTDRPYGYGDVPVQLIDRDFAEGKIEDAEKRLKELREFRTPLGTPYSDSRVQFFEAQLAIMKGDWKAAQSTFVLLVPKLQGDPQFQLRALFFSVQTRRRAEIRPGEQFALPYQLPLHDGNDCHPAPEADAADFEEDQQQHPRETLGGPTGGSSVAV